MSRQIASTSSRARRPEAIRLPATPAPTIRMRGGRSVIAGLSSSAFRSGTLGDEGDEAAAVGALMLGARDAKIAVSLSTLATTAPTAARMWRCWSMSPSLSMVCGLPRTRPLPRRLALDEACANEARVARAKLALVREAKIGRGAADAVGVERVGEDVVGDAKRPRPFSLMPTTMTSLPLTSTPAEQLATERNPQRNR